MVSSRNIGVLAALLALVAVALGAFGAHALAERLNASGGAGTWETAARYQMWHALALLALAAMPGGRRSRDVAAACFAAGIVLFSGSLYGLALGGPGWLGPVTPLGGMLLMAGWASAAWHAVSSSRSRDA